MPSPPTSEAQVRQQWMRRLASEYGYHHEHLFAEFPIRFGSRNRGMLDIAVFASAQAQTQEDVRMIVECKRSMRSETDINNGVEQLKTYLNVCPSARVGVLTTATGCLVFLKTSGPSGVAYHPCEGVPTATQLNALYQDDARPDPGPLSGQLHWFTDSASFHHVHQREATRPASPIELPRQLPRHRDEGPMSVEELERRWNEPESGRPHGRR